MSPSKFLFILGMLNGMLVLTLLQQDAIIYKEIAAANIIFSLLIKLKDICRDCDIARGKKAIRINPMESD